MSTQITDDDIVKDDTAPVASVLPGLIESANMKVANAVVASAPNRSRRTYFVFVTWGLSFVGTVGLSIKGGDGTLAKAAIDGFTGYMMAVATMYILGHSIDRADFINKARDMMAQKAGGEQ